MSFKRLMDCVCRDRGLKVYSKAEVLAKMEEKCDIVASLISEAYLQDITSFSIPVCLGVVVDDLLDEEYTQCTVPEEDEIEVRLAAVVENNIDAACVVKAEIEEYYWDGEIFTCNVRFTGVTNEG